ncbi:MAG: RIP metalloprotease RseP [Gallionellales bacterium GWA2_60_142]|nr:MAG: RIP metalloprotease RseP [Gallionellales bacterium GWA2_60_142]HCI14719.1 RIP metalloprotease RseP [Gallionellaceae bacterium]
MITLLAFVVAIALLVVFHELGHYWVARRCGVKVLRFSVGFGKVLYSKRLANGTEWAISAIPLGGYVKMLDEHEGEVAPEELDQAFNRKPVLQRMAIVVAGPLSNFLLAIVLYWALFVHGVPGLKPVLGEVPPDTPAAAAVMQPGETITHIDGEPVPSWQELRWMLLDHALQQAEVKIEGRSAQGEPLAHVLDMRGLNANELDGELLAKLGLQLYQPHVLPVIGKLSEGGVAQQAGLQPGDVVMNANGRAMQHWSELVEVVRTHPGQTVQFDIRRGEQVLSVTVMPNAVDEGGEPVGKIGAAPQVDKAVWESMLTEVSYGPLDALLQALRKTWETSIISLKMLGKMVLGEVSMKNLSGPITIADYAGQSAEMGLVSYLGFLALISVSLGVLNLLPIPLLDGGHLLYYAAELAKGSPVSEQAWELGQKIGMALLGTLMVFALYNDITRLISG